MKWGALGEARPGQSSLSAGALRYRAWAQSWMSALLGLGRSARSSEAASTRLGYRAERGVGVREGAWPHP